MGKNEILQNLIKGSQESNAYRRYLVENIRKQGWDTVVREVAVWLNYRNLGDVEDALTDYLANDEHTQRELKRLVAQ